MPLKMSQIVRNTDGDRVSKGLTTVKVLKPVKYGVSRRTKLKTAAANVYSLDRIQGKLKRNKYVVKIEFLPKTKVRLSCSCPDFVYAGWEYALWKKGSAELIYGNGEPPVEKNPRLRPGCCVAKGSLVQTSRGPKRIEDVRINDYVWTSTNSFAPVAAHQRTRRNAQTLRFRMKDGRTLEVTPDHLILAVAPADAIARWVRADEITLSHLLVTSLTEHSALMRKELDAEAIVLGSLIAEQGEIGYAPMEASVSEGFRAAYAQAFSTTFDHSGSATVLHEKDVAEEVWSTLKIKPCPSSEKELPEYVFTQSFEYRMSLVYALFQGDGWISRKRTAATYATQSRKLAEQVSTLLIGLGFDVGYISSEYSGDCANLIYLVRLTRRGAYALSTRLPLLTKYGEDYFEDAEGPLHTFRLPFSKSAIRARVVAFAKAKMRAAAPIDADEIIPLRHAAKRLGVNSDVLIAYFRRHLGDHLSKLSLPHAYKPLLAAPKHLIWEVFVEHFFIKKGYIPAYLSGKASTQSLDRWIRSLPSLVRSEVQAYYDQIRKASFSRIDSIQHGRSDVYDLTVPGPENFTANGVVVHNCKHLIALYAYLQERNMVEEIVQ